MNPLALVRIPAGVLVQRSKAQSPWADYTWRVIEVFPGELTAAAWTPVGLRGETDTFFAGSTMLELYRTETPNYRDNLATGAPSLWVVLRPTGAEPPFSLLTVTADPAEGEAATEAGGDLVDAVAMPPVIRQRLEAFVAEHGIDRAFVKRQRERPQLEALARGKARRGGTQ
ncbi:MAG: DUF3305 domain-containing protein [Hyphomicrobiaceae bacterium]|nr:DUF3305 domain-containing protein [Hyphomicrobiaceae bacterium]